MQLRRLKQAKGQALVELAFALPIFLLVVVGVFEFGRAITNWHDLNNSAQVAARYAVVNRYPGCPSACSQNGFLAWAESDLNSAQLRNDSTTIASICYRDDNGGGATAGDPVTVTIKSTFSPAAFIRQANITLRGKATLRLEQDSSFVPPLTLCSP